MASSAITIRIDYGEQSGSGAGDSRGVGEVPPTPTSVSGLAAAGPTGAVAPTPFDSGAHGLAQTESGGPAPSPSLVPDASAGFGGGSMDLAGAPTPSATGGGSTQPAGDTGDVVPTPMDSVHGRVNDGLAPGPDAERAGHAGDAPPEPSRSDDTGSRSGRKSTKGPLA